MALPMSPSALPMFSSPPGMELWELGERENWPELEALLNGLDKFYVIDARTEAHSRSIARRIEASRSDHGDFATAVHCLLEGNVGGDNHQILKRLLALGVHPDIPIEDGTRPSHLCSMNDRTACARVLAVCRPDLSAFDRHGNTPLDYGNGDCMWTNLERRGFSTIAKLAHDQKWWAVKNLCRRRVVPDDEVTNTYRGRSALQWAAHHGQMRLVDELRYLLGFQQDLPVTSLSQQTLHDEVTSRLRSIQDRQVKFRREFEDQLRGIKEAVSTCVSEIGEVSENLGEKAKNATEDCEKKIQAVKEHLLSSMQEQKDDFKNQLELLKEIVVARESIVDEQLKFIRDEVAKLAAASVNSITSSAVSESVCPQQHESGTRNESCVLQ